MYGKQKELRRPWWKIFPLAFEREKVTSHSKYVWEDQQKPISHTKSFSHTMVLHNTSYWMIDDVYVYKRRLHVYLIFLGDLNDHIQLLYEKFMRNNFYIFRQNDFWFRVVYWWRSILKHFEILKWEGKLFELCCSCC